MKIKVAILTLSDKGAKGEREDVSGKILREIVEEKLQGEISYYEILPDEKELIKKKLIELNEKGVDLILTTGGTGGTPRDVTPDATLEVIEKRFYGMEILMMIEGLKITPFASLSRAVVGSRGGTLIINLPGNRWAVKENLLPLIPVIPHLLKEIKGQSEECEDLRK